MGFVWHFGVGQRAGPVVESALHSQRHLPVQADARQFAKEALDAAENKDEKDLSASIKVRVGAGAKGCVVLRCVVVGPLTHSRSRGRTGFAGVLGGC